MTEKVIFEFRADDDESGWGFECGHGLDDLLGPEPSILACCGATGTPGMFHGGGLKRSHHFRDNMRHHMRETLDLFEQMYDDLFGREESNESEDPESD